MTTTVTSGRIHVSGWHLSPLSVLAGVGLGCLIGVFTSKWLARGRGGRNSRQQSQREREGGSQASATENLVSALTTLTAEVAALQASLSDILHVGRRVRRRTRPSTEASVASEFVSARLGSSDDEFFEFENDEEAEQRASPTSTPDPAPNSTPNILISLDKLGESTLEQEEVCHSLIGELSQHLEGSPDSVELLWRLSRAQVHLSMHYLQAGRVQEEKELLVQSAEHAQRALELDKEVWQSHKWYAIALGSQVKYEGNQRKITAGHEYKEHIDTAIALNPNEPNLFYLRGRWSFEVAGLSWLEKKAAAALYATPPDATYQDALSDFMTSEGLRGGVWKANLMMVGKCHLKLGDVPTALEWLNEANRLQVLTTEDKSVQKELDELLATYNSN